MSPRTRHTRNQLRWILLACAPVVAMIGFPAAGRAVLDLSPIRVHAITATGFGNGTRWYDISAGPGAVGTVTITEPVGNQAYTGSVTCLTSSGPDAIVGAMVSQQGSGTGLTYGVLLRLHDAGPGGTGDTISEETPWTSEIAPDCGSAAAATPMPVISGYVAVDPSSDGGPGSVTGSGQIDLGGGHWQSFTVTAERDLAGFVSGTYSMFTSAGGSFQGTVDCLSVFGTRAVVGATLYETSPPFSVFYQTAFIEDGGPGGAGDTVTLNAISNVSYPDCAAAPESPGFPFLTGEVTVSTDPLPTPPPPEPSPTPPEPSPGPTPEPSPTPTPGPSPTPTPGPTQPPPLPPAIDFVTANGRELEVGGRPWRFVGINMYNAASDGWCNFAYTDATFAAALDEIGLGGDQHGVIRAWFFQPQAIDKATDSRTWQRLDRVLRVAAEKGYRVIPTLTDQWGECGSDAPNGYKGINWYTGGYMAVDPGMVVSYRDWVAQVVTRYRDDPTILAWQLINEGELNLIGGCPTDGSTTTILRDWARDVSDLVRAIDPNHLISLGTIGGGQCGAVMTQWRDLHDLPSIDMCEVHDYSGSAAPPIYGDQWNGLQRRIEQCAALGKPLFVGEVGMGNGIGLQARADAFQQKLAFQANAGIVGHLAWGWRTTEQYSIASGDPALDVLRDGPYRVVTSTADIDDGSCDAVTGCELREAMDAANVGIDNGSIRFDLPVGSGPIHPSVGLPGFNGDVIVDGRPLPGDTTPVPVVIDGDLAGNGANGIPLGSRVTLQGLEIRDFSGSGVRITGADNLVGGTEPGDGNRIVGNANGVAVADLDQASRNAILGNELAANTGLSINLGERDPDTLAPVGTPVGGGSASGPNEHLPAPIMSAASPGDTTASGSYHGYAARDYRIEVFWSPSCPIGRSWAQVLVGTDFITMPAGSSPALPISVPAPGGLAPGFLTATATDHFGNTSEVGPCAAVSGPFDVRLASLSVTPGAVSVTRTAVIDLTAINDGPSTAIGAVVAVGWPTGSLAIEAIPTDADCQVVSDPGSTYVACWPASLAPGNQRSVQVTVRALTVGDVSIDAIATGLVGGDLDGSNDTASIALAVAAAASTPQGSAVSVSPADPGTGTAPIEMTFGSVLVAGDTTLAVGSTGPAVASGFKLGNPPTYYDLATTATFAGAIEICVTYDEDAYVDEDALRLNHYDGNAWADITTSHDLVANRICGSTTSLSPFAIFERSFAFSGFFAPVDNPPVLNKAKAGSAVPLTFSLGGDHGLNIFADGSPSVTIIACGTGPVDTLESTAPATANGLSYDPVSGRYTWVWKTPKSYAGTCRELMVVYSDGTVAKARFTFTK